MSPDDIDRVALGLFDVLVNDLGAELDENDDFVAILNYLQDALEPYVTRERNYN